MLLFIFRFLRCQGQTGALKPRAQAQSYLRQVESGKCAVSCYFPGNIQGDDITYSLHLMNDSISVGHGLSVSCAWLPPKANHSVNLSLYFFCKKTRRGVC